MTQEEFNNLSAYQQEEFINSGGQISQPTSILASSHSDASTLAVNTQKGPSIEQALQAVDEAKESSAEASIESPSVSLYTEGFDIKDPFEMLLIFDENIRTGKVKLHDWQIKFLLDFASGGQSDKTPFQAVVRACNGSGKDKYLIAPCAVWMNMRHYRSRCIVTSSSGVQLDNQTCAYITQLCNDANRTFGGNIWKCNYRSYVCLATESPITCYATDEPGKAEGFHPLEFGRKMGILISEDKSVPDEINLAINKCTGYTHRIHVSTPGNAYGHFYDLCSSAIKRDDIKSVSEVNPEDYIEYHVKASDCSHLSKAYAKQMERDLPGGKEGAAYKSQVEAEFAVHSDDLIVLPFTYIWIAKKLKLDLWNKDEHNKAGLDLSDGGAETVLITRNGNRMLSLVPFKFDNSEDTVAFLDTKFEELELIYPDSFIFGDCIGIGKPILDRLKRMGWSNIRYFDSRRKSLMPNVYKNYGAEMWFKFASWMKRKEILILDDPVLHRQLSTRYYKLIDGKIHQLLSKQEQRSKGYPSPDRADACVYAFADFKGSPITFDNEQRVEKEPEPKRIIAQVTDFTLQSFTKTPATTKEKFLARNSQRDLSYLEDEIAEFNRKLKLERKV